MQPLVLASTSPFRAELLHRLRVPFETFAPEIDESPLPGESPDAMVRRLSLAKAQAASARYPQRLVIASDQCAVHGGRVIGKPGTHDRALAQLRSFSGGSVEFLTGLCLLETATGDYQLDVVPYRVTFRALDDARIERYLRIERPYHCAGSFKSEGLGVTLFERMDGEDPTALIGLPLIRLTSFLARAGMELPLPESSS